MRLPNEKELEGLRIMAKVWHDSRPGSRPDIGAAVAWIDHVLLVNSPQIAGYKRAVVSAEIDLEDAWQYLAAQKKALRDAIGDALANKRG